MNVIYLENKIQLEAFYIYMKYVVENSTDQSRSGSRWTFRIAICKKILNYCENFPQLVMRYKNFRTEPFSRRKYLVSFLVDSIIPFLKLCKRFLGKLNVWEHFHLFEMGKNLKHMKIYRQRILCSLWKSVEWQMGDFLIAYFNMLKDVLHRSDHGIALQVLGQLDQNEFCCRTVKYRTCDRIKGLIFSWHLSSNFDFQIFILLRFC